MPKTYAPNLLTFEFQKSVITKTILTPPTVTTIQDRYLIGGTGTGAWTGKDWQIAMWDGAAWLFTAQKDGMLTKVKDEGKYYTSNGTAWTLVDLHNHANKTLLDSYTQSEANLADAVSKKHNQGTDQGLDTGGANAVTAAQCKEAYTKRAVLNVELDCIEFDL